MSGLLIDSSIIIDFLRRKEKEKTLYYTLSVKNLSISIVTHTELFSGKSVWESKNARDELEALFSDLTIHELTIEISELGGKIKATYSLDLIDSIIAATAIQNNLELVTLNQKDFEKIAKLALYTSSKN